MVGLNKPLSVRLADEDAVFLAALRIDDAITASDKVRALIRQARGRAATPAGYSGALSTSRETLAGSAQAVRQAEDQAGIHSGVVLTLLSEAEELLALALAAPEETRSADPQDLARYESRLVERAARIAEHLLRWSVTPTAPAYDPPVVSRRIAALADLIALVASRKEFTDGR
jgi:hypothetical protein